MERLYQRQRNLRVVSQKASKDKAEVAAETFSEASGEGGKMRLELQLAMEVFLPEMSEKTPLCEQSGLQGSPELKQQGEKSLEAGKDQAPLEQKNDEVTEHLGLQVPCIMVSGAQPEWSSSRLDLAIENELEKRRMEFELIRLKYEHEENERQRQHEERMEQLRQQGAVLQKAMPHEQGHGHLFLPQDQFTLFLYCFIFIHVIYVTKELMFFLIKENEMYVIGAILTICVLKMFCK
uniref:Transmembrane protein 247 n=1 Tax=Salvator merianae TaxID=96440 RepID=A0A8D0DZ52_SALMN